MIFIWRWIRAFGYFYNGNGCWMERRRKSVRYIRYETHLTDLAVQSVVKKNKNGLMWLVFILLFCCVVVAFFFLFFLVELDAVGSVIM